MTALKDGPISNHFKILPFQGNIALEELGTVQISPEMAKALDSAPQGACVSWGIPFEIGKLAVVIDQPVEITFPTTLARWLVFLHTSDLRRLEPDSNGFIPSSRGRGRLGEHAADYVVRYADGNQERLAVRRRHQLGAFQRGWGENCFEAVAHRKPRPLRAHHEQVNPGWGWSQTRVDIADSGSWVNWLYAWENPHPEKAILGLRLEPVSGVVLLFAVSSGDVSSNPLRWRPRRKASFELPDGQTFSPELDEQGLLKQIQLDLGTIISATPRPMYPEVEAWKSSYNNQPAVLANCQILLEYTSHEQACFHIPDGVTIPVMQVEETGFSGPLQVIPPAEQLVHLRVIEKESRRPVPVKLHLHGEWGEYLAPNDRHRLANPAWFEDYSADFIHLPWGEAQHAHPCTYINGETTVKLPFGKVYCEISKGFEIRPLRTILEVKPGTEEITLEVEKVLPWREKGWVSADTHVHFLSPVTALLEGSAEGVNIINLLASQWGELMTNVGDFDGRTTWGSKEAGGEGEYLVRVGTENRQHILGHISLLGYRGAIIAPMTSGGPDESALGDPIEVLLTEWARQCRAQGGLVVLPHFPNPRAEHAASIVSGDIDALEMTSWGNLYGGIDPYSLSDWYRYLNCGYQVAVVGGTDKMTASTAVGTVRTYAHIPTDMPFTYQAWMDAVRRGETFVSYGPLLDFAVDGRSMGSQIELPATGGTLDVIWEAASVTIPMSRIELVVNGEIRESKTVDPWSARGTWSVHIPKSAWLALIVRGGHADRQEIIAAHSSTVMARVAGSPMIAAADAVTILEQIEGALAYLDTVGTQAEERVYKRMRLVLTASQRALHNRMHDHGIYHDHALEHEASSNK